MLSSGISPGYLRYIEPLCTGGFVPISKTDEPRLCQAGIDLRPTYEGPDAKRLDAFVQKHPDATLETIRDGTGKACSIMAVHRALQRLGWRYKKSRYVRVSKMGST